MTTSPPSGKAWFKQQENLPDNHALPLAQAIEHLSFDTQGLIPVITQCHETQAVLMMAWMNKDALTQTLEKGYMCYWSRSRSTLWRKGESSGHLQRLVSLHIDCDGDTLLAKVEQTGAACHTNRSNCFFWTIDSKNAKVTLSP